MANSQIKIQRLAHGRDLPLPRYSTSGSAAFDLVAAVDDDVTLKPGQRLLVPTGIAISLPPTHELQIRPRSGHAIKHGVTIINAPGTIDSDYRGEIGVILIHMGDAHFIIKRGMRIAQAVMARIERADLIETDRLDASERASGGFGSTGDFETDRNHGEKSNP